MNGLLGLGDLIDRMSIINIKVYMLETKIKDLKTPAPVVKMAARMVRKLCHERMVIKNIINSWSGTGFEDIKVETLEGYEKVLQPSKLKKK